MKRFILSFVVVLLVAGCGKREGVVPSQKRIDKVLAVENRIQESDTIFAGVEYVAEQWTWEGKKVIRIDYRGENQYSENFFHDGRKIVRTTVPAYYLRSEFKYEGRRLEQIEVFRRDKLSATMSFIHDDDGVNEIVCRRIVADSDMLWPMWTPMPLKVLLGNGVAEAIGRDVAAQMKQTRSMKSAAEVHYALTWDKDHESVVSIAVSGSVEKPYTITLSYDDKKNPYNQLFANHELNETIFGFRMLSEHNVTSIQKPFENNSEIDFRYSYTYDGDYPSSRKLNYKYLTRSVFSDSVTISVEKSEKYIYL